MDIPFQFSAIEGIDVELGFGRICQKFRILHGFHEGAAQDLHPVFWRPRRQHIGPRRRTDTVDQSDDQFLCFLGLGEIDGLGQFRVFRVRLGNIL